MAGSGARSRPRRLAAVVVTLALAATTAGACTAGGRAGATAGNGRNIVVAYNNKINSLDPINVEYQQANVVLQGLYDTLVTYDADQRLVGRLASGFALSPDATAVDITLREGVTFHDGTPLTAADVAYTLDRTARLARGAATYLTGYAGTEVRDAGHLTIRLTKPNSLILGGLSKIYILNSALVRRNEGTDDAQSWLSANDAGSGPYRLTEARQGDTFGVHRHPGYWEFDPARPDELSFRLITESATQRDELRAGNLDVATTLTATDAATLDGIDGVTVRTSPTNLESVVVFNMVDGPTTNPAVRKAIQLAYDYQGALRAFRGGAGSVAAGPLPNTMSCRPGLPPAHRDLAEARRILDRAGIGKLTLTMSFQPSSTVWKQEATLLQSNLAEIGVTLNLEPIAFADYLSRLSDRSKIPQMMLLEEFAQFPDPGALLVRGYHSESVGTNRSGYADPELDALLRRALASPTAEQACPSYLRAQELIDRQAITLPMYTLEKSIGFANRVSGVRPATVGSGVSVPDLRLSAGGAR
ncbi:ABC transporter substrate-binding protein [Saccharopolyspora sp. NPDC003752]